MISGFHIFQEKVEIQIFGVEFPKFQIIQNYFTGLCNQTKHKSDTVYVLPAFDSYFTGGKNMSYKEAAQE